MFFFTLQNHCTRDIFNYNITHQETETSDTCHNMSDAKLVVELLSTTWKTVFYMTDVILNINTLETINLSIRNVIHVNL